MLSFLTFAALGLATLSHASPLTLRQSNACSSLGHGATSNTSLFNLYAYNVNDAGNSTGLPLVVATVPGETPDLPIYGKLSTWASYQQGPLTVFSLENNTLVPSNAARDASDLPVPAASEIEWQFISPLSTPAPDPIYCVVENLDPAGLTDTALLVVNDGTGSYSLCTDTASGWEVVVWDAAAENGGKYDYSTCSDILVHVHYAA